jgi:hypothetical protein
MFFRSRASCADPSRRRKENVLKIQGAATQQIHDAIGHLYKGALGSAVTLAHAAENQLGTPGPPHLFTRLKDAYEALPKDEKPEKHGLNNQTVWLKHGEVNGEKIDQMEITKDDAILYITRAISKFVAIRGGLTGEMASFRDWALKPETRQKFRRRLNDRSAPFCLASSDCTRPL